MRSTNQTQYHSKELRETVERDLDANYHMIAIAHPNRTIATWYLLTVLEDSLRGLFIFSKDEDAPIVEFHLDSQKYSARFALDRIRRESSDTSSVAVPVRVIPKLYIKTAELLQAGVDFKAANQICSAAHAGTVYFSEQQQTIDIIFDDTHHDKRYAALELLGHMPLDMIDHSAHLYAWARRKELQPRVVHIIARSTRISSRNVLYSYNRYLAEVLAGEMMQSPSLVPEGWQFPWGGRHETILLINSMCVRCMYHWIAVHFGASLHGLRGGGESSLLHITTMPKLVADVDAMCSLGETRIRPFLEYLRYGYSATAPDPALQPIVPLSNEQVAIPCLLYLSSNHERNLLGLQARIDSKKFHSLSKLFEVNMVRDLLEAIHPRWPHVRGNATIRANGEFEEIDLLIADPGSRIILACELRWMLQPGDPREVHNRKTVCREKVEQLARKVQWLRTKTGSALEALDVAPVDATEWHVEGVVVIQTFGGTLSNDAMIPIMTERIFLQGMQNASSLRHFSDWSQSLRWLPHENEHFRVVPQKISLNTLGKPLAMFGIEKLCSSRTYIEFVERSLSALCSA